MSQVTTKMGLTVWNQPLDPYDFTQLANDWNKIDFHDHSPGRGVPIPMGGIAPGAVGPVQLASNVPVIVTGSIVWWPQSSPPSGYLVCDGSAYQISAYTALYAVLGSTYNTTAPSGYFNVPAISSGPPAYGGLTWVIKS